MKPTETYSDRSICDHHIELEVYGDVGRVTKISMGSRFDEYIKCYPQLNDNYQQAIEFAFDFFRNYAPLLNLGELKFGWECYKKAQNQRCDSVQNAFWQYLEGKSIKMVGRKGSVFKWV